MNAQIMDFKLIHKLWILLFNKNEHLNKRFNSCLEYLLWEYPWFGKSVKGCSLMHSQEPLRSGKLYS